MNDAILQRQNLFRIPWCRNILLAFFDCMAIVLSALIINFLTGCLVCPEPLLSVTTILILCPVFIAVADMSKLYPGGLFTPGMPLAPHEELRRLFYILLLLASIRFFHFPGFAAFIPTADRWGIPVFCLRLILVALPFPVSFMVLIVMRWIARTLMIKFHVGIVPVAVWGAGGTGQLVMDILKKSRYHGMRPAVVIDDDPNKTGRYISGIEISGSPEEALSLKINHLIICVPFSHILEKLRHAGNKFRYVSIVGSTHGFPNHGSYLHDLYGITVVECRSGLQIPLNLALRSCMNFLVSSLALMVFFPVMLLIAAMVKLSSPGPVFHTARRLGKNGKPVVIHKFRTMYSDADTILEDLLRGNPDMLEEWNRSFKLKNDIRITPLGRLLRKTSLDELPQLFSVLKGELNLIGPRPIVEDEVKYFGDDYPLVSSVTPGITGMWQVSGRNDTSYQERVLLEKYYVMNWSPWLDIYILLKTVLEVVLCRGAY